MSEEPDAGTPVAYTALGRGVPMLTSSGHRFGTVEHVLQIPEEDVFDGIVAGTEHGLRFVARDCIDEITATAVRCSLTDDDVLALPAPETDAPMYSVDALADSGSSLHDRLGRLFGRPHWTRKD